MSNFKEIFALILSFILLYSCAKPIVVNVTLPEDKKSNCEQLEAALDDAQEFRRKAIRVLGNTPQNQARAMLFWPALMVTYLNAHEAIVAASERTVHIINIMQNKNCKNIDNLIANVQISLRVQSLKDLKETYDSLNDLYKSGGLTEKEYQTQKKKILGQ